MQSSITWYEVRFRWKPNAFRGFQRVDDRKGKSTTVVFPILGTLQPGGSGLIYLGVPATAADRILSVEIRVLSGEGWFLVNGMDGPTSAVRGRENWG